MRRLLLGALLAVPAGPAAGAERPAPAKFQNVTVRPGDTLWAIANAYLKDPTRWNELLEHNRLPSSDPTVALPGMVLRVPVAMIKESMLAASLVLALNEVLARRRETPEWKPAVRKMQLFRDDGLRTLASSRARVQFVNGELLNLDENSMAILKPRDKNADLELMRGVIHASQSKVITASARITPRTKGTKFSAQVREDLSTLVQVYTGLAAVEGEGKTLEVRAGFATEVTAGGAPSEAMRLPDTPEFRARAAGSDVFSGKLLAAAQPTGGVDAGAAPAWRVPSDSLTASGPRDIGQIGFDLRTLQVGVPVAAFFVQAARDRDFARLLLQKSFEADERIDLSRSLSPGRYWFRVAVVDLLGVQGRFSEPRQYNVSERGTERVEEDTVNVRFDVIRPPDGDDYVRIPKYRIRGKGDVSLLSITINGRRVRMDESGNFVLDVLLREGPNRYVFVAQDARGREREIVRKVVYEP